MTPQPRLAAGRTAGEWLVSLPTLLILLVIIFLGTGEYIHSQLLKLGERQWDQYFVLRADLPDPECNAALDVDAEVNRLVAEANVAASDELDLFAEPADPEAIRQSVERSLAMCREKWAIAQDNRARLTDEVRIFRAVETGVAGLITVVGEYKQFLLLLLLMVCAASTTLTRHHIGLRSIHTRTDYRVATVMQLAAHTMLVLTAVTYRNAELAAMADGVQVQGFFLHGWWIAGFGGLALISLYQLFFPPKDLEPGGGLGHALLAVPLYAYMAISTSLQFWLLPLLGELTGGGSALPYYQGIAVYLSQMMELSGMFLSLALYVWIGMLLKQTRVTELFFNVIRPWTLSPELLCFVVLVLAAWPTAFTGASGIFVIAAGTILYAELRRNNTRRGLALATTAMSGSMGVVLAPCLLVVIIAALNKDVTTGEMYHYGFMIYLLTAFLFLAVSQLFRRDPVRVAPVGTALPQSLRLMAPLVPYVVIVLATIGVYSELFNQGVDEFSAPYILPVILLAVLLYDKTGDWVAHLCSLILLGGIALGGLELLAGTGELTTGEQVTAIAKLLVTGGLALLSFRYARRWEEERRAAAAGTGRRRLFETALREATNETTGHIGALLVLMALSVSVGGMIERSHVMDLFPHPDSVWMTMTILVVIMVFIGMIMDPYGAVILVNATIAQVAFQAGIDPLHFWMFALLSFELGYLTPPVALNHLLTRHLIGDREVQLAKDDATAAGLGWWYRHERYVLPVTIMFIALVIVAYGPLLYAQVKGDLPLWVQSLFAFSREG